MEIAGDENHFILNGPTLETAKNGGSVEPPCLISDHHVKGDKLDADTQVLKNLSNLNEGEAECSNLDAHDEEVHISQVDELINHSSSNRFIDLTKSNLDFTVGKVEESNYALKSEIEIEEIQIGFQTEIGVRSEQSNKPAQLQINLEQLSYTNQSHKKAIDNLPNLTIRLKGLDSRIIKKVEKIGFIRPSDLLPPRPRKASPYPRGLKTVVFEKDKKFDKRAFYNANRRGARIQDKGEFLKYKCPTCRYRTYSFNGLSKHHVIHGFKMEYTFTCPDCNFTARHKCAMERHQQSHKKEPDLACPHCPYITRFDVGLRTHLRRWHLPDEESNTLRCTYCNYVSVCKTTYDAHLMVHMNRGENYLSRFVHKSAKNTGAEVLKCKYCKFKTLENNSLRRHMQETHKIIKDLIKKELYRCKECGLETKHRFSFRDHMLIHKKVEDASLLQCYDCGFKTKWRKLLVVHMRTEHSKLQQQKETVYYHCAECDKKFPKKYSLKAHIFQQHKESESFMCHDCDYTSKNIYVLRSHAQTQHINPKKKIYQCQNCSLISENKEKHKAHLRTHKYECYTCGLKTPFKGALKHHIEVHMSKERQKEVLKMHRCPCCEYETRDKHLMQRHMKRWRHHQSL